MSGEKEEVQIVDGEFVDVDEVTVEVARRELARVLDSPEGAVHVESVTRVGNGLVFDVTWFVPFVAKID